MHTHAPSIYTSRSSSSGSSCSGDSNNNLRGENRNTENIADQNKCRITIPSKKLWSNTNVSKFISNPILAGIGPMEYQNNKKFRMTAYMITLILRFDLLTVRMHTYKHNMQ